MTLNELKEGHIFGYRDGYAIKLRGSDLDPDEDCTIMPIDNYYLLPLECEIFPICKIEEYIYPSLPNDKEYTREIKGGYICWTGHPFGMTMFLLATNVDIHNKRMVASLKDPTLTYAGQKVHDYGYSGDFFVFEKSPTRICPNCGEFTLEQIKVINYEIECKCKNCFAEIKIK